MLTARILSMLLFLCYHIASTNALTSSVLHCFSFADWQMPSATSCYAAIYLMPFHNTSIVQPPGLSFHVSSGDCDITIRQIAGPPAYRPSMGYVASLAHIMWPLLRLKARQIVRSCFEERRTSVGVTQVAGLHEGTVAEFSITVARAR